MVASPASLTHHTVQQNVHTARAFHFFHRQVSFHFADLGSRLIGPQATLANRFSLYYSGTTLLVALRSFATARNGVSWGIASITMLLHP
jgi:hypothetical protein